MIALIAETISRPSWTSQYPSWSIITNQFKIFINYGKKSKKQHLSEGQERLLDLFAGINRWTTRGENKAFVFLSDGKECLLFANKLEDLSCDMAMTINHDPKMASIFSMMAEDVSILTDSMREDILEWKEQYDSVRSYQQDDLPQYFFYGYTTQD